MPLRDLWAASSAGSVERALAVKPLYASYILAGMKRWELRKQNSQIRGKVAIFASSTGCIWGTVVITSTVWKSTAELQMPSALNNHQVSTEELSTYCRSTGAYAWILSSPCLFQQPVSWAPPLGTAKRRKRTASFLSGCEQSQGPRWTHLIQDGVCHLDISTCLVSIHAVHEIHIDPSLLD